ncbi:uncharacterized protein LOC142224835 [Haematobia irritans]|uniref:uncharacterized protein LOC142224835 n=1 Tax=Haematobia irritans TaxID=7368 RepID=UPI003F4FB396
MVTDVLSHGISSILDKDLSTTTKDLSTTTKDLSTTTNLVEFTSHVINQFVVGNQTHVIYTDFSKAFDRVNHKILAYKLDRIELASTLWLGFRRILIDVRRLYLLVIPIQVNSRILMYADDVKLFSSFDNSGQVHLLQGDLDSFDDWCRVNLKDLNLRKCKFMRFFRSRPIDVRYSIRGSLLEEVDSFVDLGIVMDRRLNFNGHIDSMRLFTALVRPILEYGSIVWDHQCSKTEDETLEEIRN